MLKRSEREPVINPTDKDASKERSGRRSRYTLGQKLAATGIGVITAFSVAACNDSEVTASNTNTPPSVSATENPGEVTGNPSEQLPWEAETNEQRYDRYYNAAVIPTGLSTEDLAAAIADRFEKWQNLSLVEPGIRDIAQQMYDEGIDVTVLGREDYSEVHIEAFEDALVDTSKSTTSDLGVLAMNTSEEAREIFLPNAWGDVADEEPYRTYIDWSNASETVDPATGRRIITVTFDKWNNSDKNFLPDSPGKGEDFFQYTFTVDESEGRAVITDVDAIALG